MGWKNMEVSPVSPGEIVQFSYEYEVLLEAVGISDWILIPRGVRDIVVHVFFTGDCSGQLETTLDKVDTVKNGSPFTRTWPRGQTWDNTQDSCFAVTAMRSRQITAGTNGTMRLQVRAS